MRSLMAEEDCRSDPDRTVKGISETLRNVSYALSPISPKRSIHVESEVIQTRITIDLDVDWEEVARLLGTRGKTETVNRALAHVLAKHRRTGHRNVPDPPARSRPGDDARNVQVNDDAPPRPFGLTTQAVPSAYPWTDVLPDDARDQLITDSVRAFQASAESDQWSVLTRVLHEWRSTAAIFADPALFAELTAPVEGGFGLVPPPVEE